MLKHLLLFFFAPRQISWQKVLFNTKTLAMNDKNDYFCRINNGIKQDND